MDRNAIRRPVLRAAFRASLDRYERQHGELDGIRDEASRDAFIEQLVSSARRALYFRYLHDNPSGIDVANPASAGFDPLRAAVRFERDGARDEAFWMVFLFVHFGQHPKSGWALIADVYGQLGHGDLWTWSAVSGNVNDFRRWLAVHVDEIKSRQPRRGFGNHRKYESLDAWSASGTGAVVASYVDWVGNATHDDRIAHLTSDARTSKERYNSVYKSVRDSVRRFGRTGAFDYCGVVNKLSLADLVASSACLTGATGPLRGARLLTAGSTDASVKIELLDGQLAQLQVELGVGFDVVEDALCNWQKSPSVFKPFRA